MFPLLGEKTGVYIPMFWVDRFPIYKKWGFELIKHIKNSVDVVLLLTDGTVKNVPKGVEHVVTPAPVHIADYFMAAVAELAKRDVGAFYYIGSDNVHRPEYVRGLLDKCMTEADVAFTDFQTMYPKDRDFNTMPVSTHEWTFSVEEHSWTDSACFRTSIFTKYPAQKRERAFLLQSLKTASIRGDMPVGKYYPQYPFFYMKHDDRAGWDRGFLAETGKIEPPR